MCQELFLKYWELVVGKTENIALPSQRLVLQSGKTDNKQQNNFRSSKYSEGDGVMI